jgi:hypothetical protein
VEEGKEGSFDVSRDGVVVSLENGREDTAGGGLDVVDFLDCGGCEVGKAELW